MMKIDGSKENLVFLEDFQGILDRLISFLVDSGRIVYVHTNGLFPIFPECYVGDIHKVNGALHIMILGNNLILITIHKESR